MTWPPLSAAAAADDANNPIPSVSLCQSSEGKFAAMFRVGGHIVVVEIDIATGRTTTISQSSNVSITNVSTTNVKHEAS